jgi:hypothetical protein
MSDRDLFDAVARKTGEDSREIARRGFSLTGPDDAGPEPENLLDVLLVDLPEAVLHERAEGPPPEGQREDQPEEAGGPRGVTCC